MKEIDLTKILKDNIDNPNNRDLQTLIERYASPHDILEAMKDACQQVLELAAENAKTKLKVVNPNSDKAFYRDVVDKQSILDTIKQVK